jgi:DNA polymerase III subunit beta
MKLTCTQENFKRAIYNCERFISKQSTLPILNNILFDCEKGILKLSATNLEMGVVAKVGAKVEKEGKITIPAKLIGNFAINLVGGESVFLELVDQNLKISSGRAKAVIKGFLANDFPLIPQKKTEFLLQIPAFKLKKALNKVLLCVALNEARVELGGVNAILGLEEIIFASTDSFRLAEYIIKLENNNIKRDSLEVFLESNSNIIIPANTLLEINRIISSDSQDLVKIAIEDGQIFFEFLGTKIVSRLINGKYPEYKHIMPKTYATRIIGNRGEFVNAIKMASIFSSGKTNEIVLEIDSKEKKVFSDGRSVEVGENRTELNFEIQGPSQKIVFNSRYLLDGINSIETERVCFLANSETTPVAIRELNNENNQEFLDYTYIVMPIKN